MRKLIAYNFVTLNGYFEGQEGDISWHKHGEEETKFAVEMLKSENSLLMGRVTYQHMESFWPTPDAMKYAPELAKGMNRAEKIVFSKTLKKVNWNNSKLIADDIVEETKKLKQTRGKDLTILGSGSILTQFAEARLIDEYQIMVDPVAIGSGTPIFKGIKHPLELKLMSTKTFKSGVLLLCYQPL